MADKILYLLKTAKIENAEVTRAEFRNNRLHRFEFLVMGLSGKHKTTHTADVQYINGDQAKLFIKD